MGTAADAGAAAGIGSPGAGPACIVAYGSAPGATVGGATTGAGATGAGARAVGGAAPPGGAEPPPLPGILILMVCLESGLGGIPIRTVAFLGPGASGEVGAPAPGGALPCIVAYGSGSAINLTALALYLIITPREPVPYKHNTNKAQTKALLLCSARVFGDSCHVI